MPSGHCGGKEEPRSHHLLIQCRSQTFRHLIEMQPEGMHCSCQLCSIGLEDLVTPHVQNHPLHRLETAILSVSKPPTNRFKSTTQTPPAWWSSGLRCLHNETEVKGSNPFSHRSHLIKLFSHCERHWRSLSAHIKKIIRANLPSYLSSYLKSVQTTE